MVELPELLNVTFKCAMDTHQAVWEHKKSKILEQLSPVDVSQLLEHSTRINKKRGELLYLSEIEKSCIYILDKGYIRSCRLTPDGRRLITGFMGPADLFGSFFQLPQSENTDYIEIVREARLISIETQTFKSVLEKYPLFMMRLLEIMENRKCRLENRILSLISKDIYAQTAEVLLELSDKFGESCATDPDMMRDIGLTHQEIADLIGIARPTVSKVISDFLKADLLRKHHHNLCLYNRDGLEAIICQGQKAL
ncbi:MAG: Crp/Fnr family transcriptional regulator [Vampirovibrionales bacterium]|nr:Crp/Fnr family transcriptional regulator [Vampirovibrionales bacterium]